MEVKRLAITVAMSVCTMIVATYSWLILHLLIRHGVIRIPVIAGVNITGAILDVRMYSFAELASPENRLYVIDGLWIPGIPGFYMFLTISLIGFLIPWYVVAGRMYGELVAMRRQVFESLQFLSAYLRTGVTLPMALVSLAKSIGRPLGPRIQNYALLINTGVVSHDKAFESAFRGLPRDVRILLGVLAIAVRGGRPADVLRSAAIHASNIRRFDEMRSSRLAGSTFIVYVGVLAYAITSVITTTLIEIFTGLPSAPAGAARVLVMPIPVEHVLTVYYISSVFLALIGSIMIARVVKGSTIVFVRHLLWLLIAIMLCFMFVRPVIHALGSSIGAGMPVPGTP